ncbi:MAG: TCR/Tet family MFS transporter [Gemmatimonadota bacterium]|nr:TCR/Tet family MFS transporter [Gemmatimonadota bacterium]MDE3172885.1 TCR/Tet family MFS transporter [Gemmatimonadota bacterium]MDE3217661.1 TCR/Tet family MFS transporter [Gemmatimonadota bacterium]
MLPVLPELIKEFMGGNTARAAEIFGVFGTVWAGMQFVFSPVMGVLSDRFGRRPVILISNFALGFDYLVMALAPSLWWLFLGRVVSGIAGASFTPASAYIADILPREKRAHGYGIIGAAWGLGFVLGPAMGGILGSIAIRLPFYAAAALTLLNAMYGLFVLPESLPPERRRPIDFRRASPVGSLKLLRTHRELFGLATVNFLYYLAHQVLPSVYVLYVAYRYGWGDRTVGLTLAAVGLATAIVQGGLVRPVVAAVGERRALMLGLAGGAVGLILFGLAATPWVLGAGIVVSATMGFYGPSVQGLMTRRVSPSEQGQLQGANSSITGITGMLGPGLFSVTFAYFIGSGAKHWHLPGAPFLLAALCLIVAMGVAWRATRPAEAEALEAA